VKPEQPRRADAESAGNAAPQEIQIIAETKEYRVYSRGNCLAMVHFTQAGDSSIGSSGIMTEQGLAYLFWREGTPVLVGKGVDVPAAAEQVEALRAFAEDLKALIP
jgi:hypothetical protein